MSSLPTSNLDILSIRNMFAPSKSTPHGMNEFYFGGLYVTNPVTPNGPIATIGNPISFGSFRGAYNSPGRVQWLTRISGSNDDYGQSICNTQDKGIVVGGVYNSTSFTSYSANGVAFGSVMTTSPGSNSAFLCKYNNTGTVQWFTRLSGTDTVEIIGVAEGLDAGIICVGGYGNTIVTAYNVDGSTFATTLPAQSTTRHPFICKYNSAGTVQWIARMAGATSGTTNTANSVSILADGGIILAGQYASTLTAYNANGTSFGTTIANAGNNDAFVCKYNSSGTVQWIAQIGSTGNDFGTSIYATSDGGLIISGYYTGTLIAYNANGTGFATTIVSAGNFDCFICKYDTSGSVQWLARIGGTGSDIARGICEISDSGIVVTGQYASTTLTAYSANSSAFGTTLSLSGGSDSFVCKYNSSGTVQWIAKQANSGSDRANCISATPDGGLVFAGQFSGSNQISYNADGTAFGTQLIPNNTSTDTFICKYSSSGTVEWNTRIAGDNFGADIPYAICTNSDGRIYITGVYSAVSAPLKAYNSDGIAFGSSLINGGTTTLYDVYVCQYTQ